MTVKIALDAMGGDRGPEEIVFGAVQAVRQADIEIILFGDEEKIRAVLMDHDWPPDKIHIFHASQVVEMSESPFEAISRKKDSSIRKAFELHKKGEVDAVVSAGNSGATMAAAIKMLGRMKKISRPGIAGIFPTLKKPVVMMDVGANVDCRPQHLFQFGVMASAFYSVLFSNNNAKPTIGLLSIGEEGGKGNALVKKSHELFQDSTLNYIGNVEGRDTFQGNVDVIVCDGFVGNVCLKLSEGLAEAMIAMLREEIAKTAKAQVGYILAKEAFRSFKARVDYAEYGGAPLLGFKGTGIVCHGRSNAMAIKNAVLVAEKLVCKSVNEHILKFLHESSHGDPLGEKGLPESGLAGVHS